MRPALHSLPVWNPDILHLRGVLKEPASLGNFRIEPVDHSPLVGPHLLKIADGHCFRRCDGGFVSITPDRIDIVVFRERLE